MTKDIYSRCKAVACIPPTAQATDNAAAVGTAVDTRGFESCGVLIQTGDLLDANATFGVAIQHSDSETTGFTEVAADDVVGGGMPDFKYDDDREVYWRGYIGDKRYVRVAVTPSGNTGAWSVSAIVMLGHARRNPPA